MKILTSEFKTWLINKALNSIESTTSYEDECFVALSDSNAPWNNGATYPTIDVRSTTSDADRKILFGQRVQPSDIILVARRIPFVSGTVYDMYDDIEDISNKNFFVVTYDGGNRYSVWKCLYNNNGLPAYVAPKYSSTTPQEQSQTSSDGYVWKFMYRLTSGEMKTYGTGSYIPIKTDSVVKLNSKPGSIEVIKVQNSGQFYNSYAYGTIKQATVSGDPRIYSLESNDSRNLMTITFDTTNTFDKNLPVNFNYNGVAFSDQGVPIDFKIVETDGSSFIRIEVQNNTSMPVMNELVQYRQGLPKTTTNRVALGTINTISTNTVPTISANTDFYKGCSFYIRAGLGAGQIRTVSEYVVTGNERRVVLNRGFNIIPDQSSRFEILPQIIISGDGTSSDGTGQAKAIPIIDPSANSISSIQVIDPGINYTYASATILSNTGYIDLSTGDFIDPTPAEVRPIISPRGGHGSNTASELYCDSLLIRKAFDGSQNNRFEVGNDFGEISLVKNVRFNRVVLQLASSSQVFNDGQVIVQGSHAIGVVYSRDNETLTLTDVQGQFKPGTITNSTSSVSAVVNTVSTDTNSFNNTQRMSITITSMGTDGTGFRKDDKVLQGAMNEFDAWGQGSVFFSNTSLVSLTNVKGVWNSSDTASGVIETMFNMRNGAVATITGIALGDIKGGTVPIYKSTVNPVTRANGQIETVKIILSAKDFSS